jgi:UDP-N-acetylglucosamine acyltransferase
MGAARVPSVNVYSLNVHPTAVVHPGAKLGRGAEVGPYCLIGEHVTIGEGTRLLANVVVQGHTTIGRDNTVYPFSVIGGASQDKKHRGEISYVRIGDRNILREYVTINRGTDSESETVIGSDNHLLAYVHIAHDCRIGNNVVMSNLSQLAGHVSVGDGANLGGMVGVHQFVRIGRLSFLGGRSKILKDVPPFFLIEGNPASVRGLNRVGLKRSAIAPEAVSELKEAYRLLYMGDDRQSTVIERLRTSVVTSEGKELLTFFETASERGITSSAGRRGGRAREHVTEEDPGAA